LRDSTIFSATESYFKYAGDIALRAYAKTTAAIMTVSAYGGFYVQSDAVPLGLFYKMAASFSPFAGLGVATGALQYLANLVLLSISITKAFSVVTEVIFHSFLNLLLPSGIVLRCFTETRELGGILISLSIGLFIFYPLMFSLSYLMINQAQGVDISSVNWYNPVIAYALIYSSASIFPMGQFSVSPDSIILVTNSTSDIIFSALEDVGATLLPVFILPALNWIIIAMLVRNISSALGAEVDISSLARMV
jgi:hypothetical protein